MIDTDLHDAEIFAVRHRRTEATLTFEICTEAGDLLALRCTGLSGFALDPFEDQNIVFSVQSYTSASLPAHLRDDLPPFYQDALSAGGLYVQLEPSVGMGGWVIAQDVGIEPLATG